ncbi:hybrid sensor histidine kinase/response regulator [Pseudobutyrivibrio sp. LB2011]|uniref:hybrid sensor histidine kinase/response regulator n=1 Tax=Pseudobutyrivibrio sp. LB2011 TaxID=1408312 RepID=UPI0006788600|nr:ATP-binding protein [Pseudobutyrivibrio sp. LB2011]
MKRTSLFIYEIVLVAGVLIYVFIIGLLIWGESYLKEERTYTSFELESYDDGWYRIYSDGTKEAIDIPGQYQPESSHEFVIEKEINVDVPLFVSFDSAKQDINAFVNGELRYSYSTKDSRLFGDNSPGALMFIPVYPEDNGQNLQIVFIGDNNYSGVLGDICIGTQLGITKNLFAKEKYALILTSMLLILGFIAFVIGLVVRATYGRTMPLFYAGWVVMCAGLWSLAESNIRQFIAPNFSLLSYMTYLSLMMLPFATAFYFDRLQEGRYRIFYLIVSVLDVFCGYIAIMLQFFNDTDLINVLIFAFIAIVLTMLIFTISIVIDFIQGRLKNNWADLVGVAGALVAGFAQILSYNSRPTTVDRGILLCGLLFFIVMSYIRALTDVRTMERDMYAAVKAQDASTAFLTRMSHEMRTPINAILGMNKMILRESREDNILDYARDVNSAGNYLLGIVNEVLDLAKVNAGKIVIEEEEYELMDMVRECYALVRPRAKASRLSFEVDMSDVLPEKLKGDKEHIIQVVTNLLTNAVKYTPEGRITLSVQGKISEGKLLLIITVSDTGIGVAEESIPFLFDSFKRVGEFAQSKIEGTGLGLTITKQLVDLMHGQISVESELGKGTSFTVVIPQEICSVEPCGTFSMGPNGDRRVADRHEVFDVIGAILVVDDVAINLRVFTMLLNDTDVTVDTAISGAEAIEKIKRTKYDIIFIDHLMPGMDGLQLKEIMDTIENNPNKDTPLIMQTANAVVGAREEYESFGFSDYIEKPIKEEELKKLLRKYMI